MNLLHVRGVPAALIALLFALVARILGSVSDGGALAGIVVAFILLITAGFAGFIPLLVLFVLTVLATRWGRLRKERLGVAERFGGRTGSQVLANLGAAACCALPALWFPEFSDLLFAGAMAALAEAAADTVSSEIGQGSSPRAYLIVGLRSVPVGTNGGISLPGTLSGIAAAFLIAWVSVAFDVVGSNWGLTIAIAGSTGMIFDSILGATWENAGRIGNDGVNFVSTVFAADIALLTGLMVGRFGR
ncbi:MAG: DUF92 domain-containing protein [Candidatus Korobacteraceae bacterium]